MRTFLGCILLSILILFNSKIVIAQEKPSSCDNRFATLVNPVRGRNLWKDKTVKSLQDQYALAGKYNVPITWLLQYDILEDQDVLSEISKFNSLQEMGVFLEVSENYSEDARVVYPHSVPWFSPQAVFLSGYSQSDRHKLIDKLFSEFKIQFGSYPKSVGAWWIDSYSLNYMKDKYNIKAAMIVADQKTTDNYGVWGQWWGSPYYPSRANILTPASTLENKQNVVIIQWAQRDPKLAYGEGWVYSNYSLQANDYIRQGKDTKYFASLVDVFLDCRNLVGQITIGLETGIESVGYIDEYGNQLKYLSGIPNLNFVTMSQFADKFSKIFPEFPDQAIVGSNWILKTNSRVNNNLDDNIKYQQDIAFKDFFIADHEDFLNRNLQQLNRSRQLYFPYFIFIILIAGLLFFYKKVFHLWIVGTLSAVFSFGLILRSHNNLGWQIFYGPIVPFLIFTQIAITIIAYFVIWLLSKAKVFKINKRILWFIPLSFGIDFIIQLLRFSYFGGKYYFLLTFDSLRHIGLFFSQPIDFGFVNQNFPSVISASLLRFDFGKIWDNLYLALAGYPLLHILLAILLGYLYGKLPKRIGLILIGILVTLTIFQLMNIFQADPRLVQ